MCALFFRRCDWSGSESCGRGSESCLSWVIGKIFDLICTHFLNTAQLAFFAFSVLQVFPASLKRPVARMLVSTSRINCGSSKVSPPLAPNS